MITEKLPLRNRLNRLKDGQAAHLEYDATVIRSMGQIEILQYLGDGDAFCELQFITEVKETLPYQVTAMVICELACDNKLRPEELRQIASILSAPTVQV